MVCYGHYRTVCTLTYAQNRRILGFTFPHNRRIVNFACGQGRRMPRLSYCDYLGVYRLPYTLYRNVPGTLILTRE